jgi:hypothetical protein
LEGGDVLLWELPLEGHDYIIGADCSEGDITSDFGCAGILDVVSGEQVGELHGHFKDHVFASKLAVLGNMYNNALIAVERNNHGHSVLNSLINGERYLNMYHGKDGKAGWVTSGKSKAELLDGSEGLSHALSNNWIICNSEGFLGECRTYEYKSTSKSSMGAQRGKHDDRVMAWAIAWYLRYHARTARGVGGGRLMVA